MALTDAKVAAVLRLKEQQERLLSEQADTIAAAQKAANELRDYIGPPALRRMREQYDQIMAVADLPYLRELREADARMKKIIEPVHIKMLADTFAGLPPKMDLDLFGGALPKRLLDDLKGLEVLDYFAGMKALMPAESLSATIAKSLSADVELFGGMSRIADVFKSIDIPDYAAEFKALAGISNETGKLLASLDIGRGYADLLAVNDVTRSLLEYETDRLNHAYAGLAASIEHRPEWIASAPDFVRTVPGEIVFAQARFVRTVTTHEEIEEEDAADEIWADVQTQTLGFIETVLPELNPKLMKSWEGTWDTARRRGPDWARQAASSMRFLLIEALEAVAPMEQVSKSNVPARYVHDGKILRLGQIHWLCEPVKNRTYGKVVRADLDSAMTIIEAMNEAVHRDDYEEIEDAFRTMAIRAAVALSNLLKLWKARQ
jgi:hypothetical protein